jgi:hypothetical protein
MFQLRKLATLGTVAVVALALSAAPAAADKPPKNQYPYVAQIDCGDGPRQVGSTDDLWAPLVDLATGKRYKPAAWNVSGDGFAVDVTQGRVNKTAVTCSYDDGVARGTVTLRNV